MLLAALIVALVCAGIDGGVQPKSNQQARAEEAKRSQRQLVAESTPTEEVKEVKEGQRQVLGNYPQNGYNYVAVGADGSAEVAFRIDLGVILERLNSLPELAQIVVNLDQKIDSLIYIIQNGAGGGGASEKIIELEQNIIARLEQQEIQIQSLYTLVEQLQGQLGNTNIEIAQILSIVQSLGSSEPGGACSQEIARMEVMIQHVMNVLVRVLEVVEQSGAACTGAGTGAGAQVLEIVQQIYAVLQQWIVVLESIQKAVGTDVTCSPESSAIEVEILQDIRAVTTMIESLPQNVVIVLQNSGILGGSNAEVITYLQQIVQLCETVLNEIMIVKKTVIDGGQEIRKYFAESQKSLVAVKKVVTETTEIVQSSAAAAISASRSMRCPTKHQRPDLDD